MSRLSSLFSKKRNTDFNSTVNAYNSTSYSNYGHVNNQKGRLNFRSFIGKPKFSKQLGAFIIIIIFAVVGFALWFKSASNDVNTSVLGANQAGTDQEQITAPYATKQIDKTFNFPLRNEKGDKVSEFAYVVQNAELTNEIVVKGQKATSVKGRTFLILNLKINNNGKQKVQVNSRDYVRLIIGDNTAELLAPDIHNDPVEVQPISTKFTRLGFAINDTDKNLKVQVGEIDGQKQYIDLNF